MRVFVSYGSSADQVTALRLQALAAVNGLAAYVPPAQTRRPFAGLNDEVIASLRESEVVLGVAASTLSEPCRLELNEGIALGKHTIVMAGPGLFRSLHPDLSGNLLLIDPSQPERAEQEIVQYLKSIETSEKTKKALLALGTVALGLLLFAPAGQD